MNVSQVFNLQTLMNINYFIIVQDIYSSFNCNPPIDVRGMFLDIPKAFDRVLHDVLIHKIKFGGINGMLFKLINFFLENRFQGVVLNGQTSS